MDKTCFLCKSSVDNELLFGRFYSKWKLTVHYYCLLLSSNLVQRGSNDTVGIFGFLESDIRKENERTKKCRCYICKDMHANVSCCSKKCLRTFHTVCGIMNGCLSHYTDTYQSWCSAHVPLEPDSEPHSPEEACSICYDEMGQYDLITSIKAPCCKNGWFHQQCLARYAESAGYFFKCPLCKNEDKFVAEVPLRGVFVPERDAAWELEPNAFQEQLLRPTACDAVSCKCEQGRTVDNRQWQLIICGSCGSTCRHRQCMEQDAAQGSQVYICQLCGPIVGERLSMLENAEDSSDSSDDDTVSTSSSVSLGRAFVSKHRSIASGSGESGVHCSSSDEPLANIRRLAHIGGRRISDDSDSERSDCSSIQIRRFVRQNTGKRVRRLLSDGSDDVKRSADTDNSTDTLPTFIERSPAKQSDDGSSDSSGRIVRQVRLTRQLTRRLSSLSDTSKRSTSESTNSSDTVRPECSSKRRRIASSSDESEKQSERERKSSEIENNLSTAHHGKIPPSSSSPSTGSSTRRLSCSSRDSDKRSENEKNISDQLDDLPLVVNKRAKQLVHQRNGRSTRSANEKRSKAGMESDTSDSTSERDENSNMTDTVPPKQNQDDQANASEMFSNSSSTKRTGQLKSRHTVTERSTSESSIELKPTKSKRTRISAHSCNSSAELTEKNEKAATAGGITIEDKVDCTPQNKRRRVARARSSQPKPTKQLQEPSMISPPSTPSSLSSETSQQSVTSSRRVFEPVQSGTVGSSRTPEALQRQQKTMLQFFTASPAQKKEAATTVDDSSELSTDEPVSTFSDSNRKNSSKKVPISKEQTVVKPKPKRRRTVSPMKKTSNGSPATDQSASKKQSPSEPTSSKTSIQHRTTPPNRSTTVQKDKGQKNILNYFNRC